MTPELRAMKRALVYLGSSIVHLGFIRMAARELENAIAKATGQTTAEVQDWAARQYARLKDEGIEAVIADIEATEVIA